MEFLVGRVAAAVHSRRYPGSWYLVPGTHRGLPCTRLAGTLGNKRKLLTAGINKHPAIPVVSGVVLPRVFGRMYRY